MECVHQFCNLSNQERSQACLNALANGVLRARDTSLTHVPAIVSFTFYPWEFGEEPTYEEWEYERARIRRNISDALFLPIEAVFIGHVAVSSHVAVVWISLYTLLYNDIPCLDIIIYPAI